MPCATPEVCVCMCTVSGFNQKPVARDLGSNARMRCTVRYMLAIQPVTHAVLKCGLHACMLLCRVRCVLGTDPGYQCNGIPSACTLMYKLPLRKTKPFFLDKLACMVHIIVFRPVCCRRRALLVTPRVFVLMRFHCVQ